MRVSTKFPVAVHAMIMIAGLSDKEKVNSDKISESTGVNAVIIRNIFKSLKKSKLILVAPGPGGTTLARPPEDITLLDIFSAVESKETEDIFKFHQNQSEHCPVGSNIYGLLKTHLDDAVDALKSELSKVTLAILLEELFPLLPDLHSVKTQ
jgi:Rrf2 family protein